METYYKKIIFLQSYNSSLQVTTLYRAVSIKAINKFLDK